MTIGVTDKQQIQDLILANEQAVRALGVARLGLFGSFVRRVL
ncbi:MAG: hypothetical protein ABTQ73_05255 [Caldilineales bacterium]